MSILKAIEVPIPVWHKFQMIKIIKLFFILYSVLTLFGCATLSYQEPTIGPRAKVRFTTNTYDIMVIRGYSSQGCDNEQELMRLRVGSLINSNPKSLGMPLGDGYHKNAAKEVYMKTNEPHRLMFNGTKSSYKVIHSCGVFVEQEFLPNKQYEMNYIWHNNTCYVSIYEIKNNAQDKWIRDLIRVQDNRIVNEKCLKVFKQTRWS